MKRQSLIVLALTLVMLWVSGCTSRVNELSEPMPSINSAEVIQAFDELVEAAKSLDTERYLSLFDKGQFTSLNADGSVYHSFEQFASSYREQNRYIKRYVSLDFQKIKVAEVDEHTAILLNEYVAKVELRSGRLLEAAGAGTQVWSKQTGQWRLVHVSSSAAAP